MGKGSDALTRKRSLFHLAFAPLRQRFDGALRSLSRAPRGRTSHEPFRAGEIKFQPFYRGRDESYTTYPTQT